MFDFTFQEGNFYYEGSSNFGWLRVIIPIILGFVSTYIIFLIQERYKRHKDNLDKIVFLKLLLKNIIKKSKESDKLIYIYIYKKLRIH